MIAAVDRQRATGAARLAIKNQVGTQATHEFARLLLETFGDLDELARQLATVEQIALKVQEQNRLLTQKLLAADAEATRLLDLVNTFQIRQLERRLERAEERLAICVRALEAIVASRPWPPTMRRLADEALHA